VFDAEGDVDAEEDPEDQAGQANPRRPAAAVRIGVLADQTVVGESDIIDAGYKARRCGGRHRRSALPSARLGTFDFFLDIGCFQGLDAGQRLSEGEGVSALASPGATVLLLSFDPSRSLVRGALQEEVETAFAGWEMLAAGWPGFTMSPAFGRGSFLLAGWGQPH
jgi:hypothetical protein